MTRPLFAIAILLHAANMANNLMAQNPVDRSIDPNGATGTPKTNANPFGPNDTTTEDPNGATGSQKPNANPFGTDDTTAADPEATYSGIKSDNSKRKKASPRNEPKTRTDDSESNGFIDRRETRNRETILEGSLGLPMAGSPAKSEIKIFTLKYLSAKQAERLIRELFQRDGSSLVADERLNQLIVRGESNHLKEIEAVLLKLDQPAKNPPSGNAADLYSRKAPETTRPASNPMTVGPPGSLGIQGAESMMGGSPPRQRDSLTKAKAAYQAAEERAAQLAAGFQQRAKLAPQDPQLPRLKSQLRDAVSEALALRQKLHEVELAALESRIRKIRTSLVARNRIRDQIINRRVEDLLNPKPFSFFP